MEQYFDQLFHQSKDEVTITFASIETRTDLAICADGIWLPLSRIHIRNESPFQPIEIDMPEWLAYSKELI